jgi:hypothetical protein
MNILYSTLKSGDIKDQFRRIKVPLLKGLTWVV